jgi:tetratricopeptide (TPR) repeat protein
LLLHYWGERGNPEAYLQPNENDETVMFYEMLNYVEEHTELKAMMRMGGKISTLKELVNVGIPVIIQKGYDSPPPDGWGGHYVIVNGYDEVAEVVILLAAYPEDGGDTPMPYAEFEQNWRAFNYSYMVVFPPERSEEVAGILGDQADEFHNYRYAVERAKNEIEQLTSDRDLFFAWFNLGTSLTYLQDYSGAQDAFNEAFSIFTTLADEERPWRILWYQTRPYWAFFYTGSYQMVVDLATSVLDTGLRPHLEESYYWRALAKEAMGDLEGAIQDLSESIRLNPNFVAGKYQLQRMNGES